MGTTITFQTGTVTLVITGDVPFDGCTYDRLEGWYGVPPVDLKLAKRPNAAGAYAPVQTFPDARPISVEGDFFGASRESGLQMRETLTELYNDGKPVLMTVADDLRTTWREVLVAAVEFPWTIHPQFEYSIDVTAADPRRYGAEIMTSTGLAAPGTGLTYPLTYPLVYGTTGANGSLVAANPGNTESLVRFVVSGGEMLDGFVIVNALTGQRITYVGPLYTGSTITIDTGTQNAVIDNSGPGSRFLSAPEWFTIPKRTSLEIQFLARGSVTGSPRLDAYVAPAFY